MPVNKGMMANEPSAKGLPRPSFRRRLSFSLWMPTVVTFTLMSFASSEYDPLKPKKTSRINQHPRHQHFLSATAKTKSAFSLPPLIDKLSPSLLQISSASAAYFSLVTYYDRPRGKLAVNSSDLLVKQSQVNGAGLGLFVTKSLSAGTILGTYPGVVLPLEKNLRKLEKYPRCEGYIWRFTDNKFVIDPTDKTGLLENVCYGGSSETFGSVFFMENILKLTTTTVLARINEPPLGMDCNVCSDEDLEKRQVIFSIARDVVQGEELFMDYGLTYDRSNYSKPS